MKLAFVHDHVFRVIGDEVYSYGRLPSDAWDRYLRFFDKVVVVARKSTENAQHSTVGLVRSDRKNVEFALMNRSRSIAETLVSKFAVVRHITAVVSEIDAVVVRLPSTFGLIAVRECKRRKIPFAIELVGCAFDSYRNHGSKIAAVYAPLAEMATARAAKDAPFVLYVTRTYLQTLYPTGGVSMSASNVVLPRSSEALSAARELRLSSAQGDKAKVAFIGSMSARYKGLDTALKAIRAVVEQGYNVQFEILAGEDPLRARREILRLGLGDICKLIPPLSGSAAVASWLEFVDIYVHPSRTEGLPRSLIEAMSVGCYCIASNVGGIPELLPKNCLHDPNDSEALATLIIGYLRNRSAKLAQIRRNVASVAEYRQENLQAKRDLFFEKFLKFVEVQTESGKSELAGPGEN